MASSRVRSKSKEIVYPESDGKPLGETGWHVEVLYEFHSALKGIFAHRQDVYIASNMFLYYVEGQPSKVVCPDCMAIFGVNGNQRRRTFKTWVEHAVPSFVLELSSRKTFRNDLGKKKEIYAELGVREYVLYDPLGDCLDTPLLGFRLDAAGVYQTLPPLPNAGILSDVLEVEIVPENNDLRLVDPRTRIPYLFQQEYREAVEVARDLAEREREHAERERANAERERERAELEHEKAEREREAAMLAIERAAQLEAELRRLKKLLGEA